MMQLHPVVWVVDDEEVNRILARAYLELLGWEVREFANGYDALRGLQHARPHALLLLVPLQLLPQPQRPKQRPLSNGACRPPCRPTLRPQAAVPTMPGW